MHKPLDQVFGALADPTRRAILLRLAKGPANVGELAAPFDISPPAISRHLKVLVEARLIERSRVGQHLICRLNPKTLKHGADWFEFYRSFWTESLDKLADLVEREYLKEDKDRERNFRRKNHRSELQRKRQN